MADRVVVMSRRPGRIKAEHDISFAADRPHDGQGNGWDRPLPFKARSAPEFPDYFNRIWNELEIHVGD
jgi:NitT/TauT family transport system ATP-binding protein